MELKSFKWPALGLEKAKIVLLHGMGGTGALWRPIAAHLENEFSILAPDQRGHGGSMQIPENERDFHPTQYAKDVLETMTREEFSPAFVVGHSMGVRTACALTQIAPEKVLGLALIDLGLSPGEGGGFGSRLAAFLRKLPDHFPSRTEAKAFMDLHCPDPAITQYLLAVARLSGGNDFRLPFNRDYLIQTLESVRGISVAPAIRHFAKTTGRPVQVYRGTLSKVWSHEEFTQDQQQFRDCPNVSFIEIEGAGHGLPFEKREVFLKHLANLLGS